MNIYRIHYCECKCPIICMFTCLSWGKQVDGIDCLKNTFSVFVFMNSDCPIDIQVYVFHQCVPKSITQQLCLIEIWLALPNDLYHLLNDFSWRWVFKYLFLLFSYLWNLISPHLILRIIFIKWLILIHCIYWNITEMYTCLIF